MTGEAATPGSHERQLQEAATRGSHKRQQHVQQQDATIQTARACRPPAGVAVPGEASRALCGHRAGEHSSTQRHAVWRLNKSSALPADSQPAVRQRRGHNREPLPSRSLGRVQRDEREGSSPCLLSAAPRGFTNQQQSYVQEKACCTLHGGRHTQKNTEYYRENGVYIWGERVFKALIDGSCYCSITSFFSADVDNASTCDLLILAQ